MPSKNKQREPAAAPPRRKSRLLLWPAIIVVMAAAMYFTKPAEKTAEAGKQRFEDAIAREVPPAATREQVEAWFEHHNIPHTYLDYVGAERRSYPGEKGTRSMAEIAGFRNEDLTGMVRGTIKCPNEKADIGEQGALSIFFFFDKNQACAGHLVDWFPYAPN